MLTREIGSEVVVSVIDGVGLGPRRENVIKSTHSVETVTHVVVEC